MATFDNFNDMVDAIHRVHDAKSVSLPQFTRPASIESPLFLQESLIEEPAVNDTIKNLYNIYIGYILLALRMNDLVVGNRRIRDILSVVSTSGIGLSSSTESFKDKYIDAKTLVAGLESLNPWDKDNKASSDSVSGNGTANRQPSKEATLSIASGRQVEVEFATPNGQGSIPVVLNVKFNPRVIPDQVVEYILSANFNQDISRRWLQMQAGEIRFINDFILNLDKLDKRANALKHDKDGALQEIFRHQNLSVFRTFFRAAAKQHKSYNLANSVMMFDDYTANLYAKKAGFKFDNISDRRKFFLKTFCLFIVLIDRRYSRVTIYTNGIDQSASFSFNELKSSGNSDKLSITEVMDYLNKSQMPKF